MNVTTIIGELVMITFRKANERGHADHGWLNAYHTFSFNTYYDENFMGFQSLRVLNDDRIHPGKGFGTHPHQDMEIITYILEGALEHKDSMGNGSVINAGDVQRMSAGTGIRHSEFNPSDKEPVHLLQIWINPKEKGITPSYEQTTFIREEKLGKLLLIASPDGRNDSVTINQDANIYTTILEKDMSITVPVSKDRHLWIHVAQGEARLGDESLSAGDGIAINDNSDIELTGVNDAEILIFDLI
jgi:redox-sensitive bicupin YhaK (pirin superfamily)